MRIGFFTGSIVPYAWFLYAAAAFALFALGMLAFIFIFLYRSNKRRQEKQQYRALFSDLIAETIIAESSGELTEVLRSFLEKEGLPVTRRFPRKVLARELVKTKENISGKSAENLRWLYEELRFDQESFRVFQKGQWHRKAGAIRHLAEMQQHSYLLKIYRETNHQNPIIRTEAQLAVVKLTGFNGLRFLNIVSHTISQWQQLSLLSHLQAEDVEESKISSWLTQKNDSVVEFALRLVEIYKCFDLHDRVAFCLEHESPQIRLQVLQALGEIYSDRTSGFLLIHFSRATKAEQLEILQLLRKNGGGNEELRFLTAQLENADEAIRFHAIQAIQQISPAWSSVFIREMQDQPSLTHILSLLQKEAV